MLFVLGLIFHFACGESHHTKILKCFIILCPRLSETFCFPHRFHSNSSYWKYQYFWSRRKFFRKSTTSQNWKLSNDTFRPKPNRKNSVHKKLFNLELWRNLITLYLYSSFKKDFKDLKEIRIFKIAGDWVELQKNYLLR